MMYQLVTTDKFDRDFKKLDRQTQRIIKAWIDKNLMGCVDPRIHGKGLTSNRSGQWRYRVGNYRIIAEINDEEFIIVAVMIAHRSN